MTAFSVIMAVIFSASVTSKAGLHTFTPAGAVCLPPKVVSSSESLCSMGIDLPSFISRSKVLDGAAM